MKRSQRGMTLAEVLVALGLVGVLIYTSLTFMKSASRSLQLNQNKQFAAQKAISILEELKAVAQNESAAITLDAYDDGGVSKPVLTTQVVGVPPLAPTPDKSPSDNVWLSPTKWLYEREVSITPMPGQSNDVRLVQVKIFINEPGGRRVMAEAASVIRSLEIAFPPTQVYDVYAIAIENVPGWWVYMNNIVPFVSSTITNLQARNPGLNYRVRYITKLSYGRDEMYVPYVNRSSQSTTEINSVYHYPGKLREPGDPVVFYYPPSRFQGRIRTDTTAATGELSTTITNDWDNTPERASRQNQWPYALADQYNHAMRYPDEVALFERRKLDLAYIDTAGKPVYNEVDGTPTWRMLIEDLYKNPQKYTNAIIINLHGELLPFPPIRNYSDAAKVPVVIAGGGIASGLNNTQGNMENVRVVTHPEELWYENDKPINLRVYAYLSNPQAPPPTIPPNDWGDPDIDSDRMGNTVPIQVTLRNVFPAIDPANIRVRRIEGGVRRWSPPLNIAQPPENYSITPSLSTAPQAVDDGRMFYVIGTLGSDIRILLFNTPLRTPVVAGGGLPFANRLYGQEYIPSPVEDLTAGGVPFSVDLLDPNPRPKNTARWIIEIPDAAIPGALNDRMFTVETRIGPAPAFDNAGTMYPPVSRFQPSNLSRTYVWRGEKTWALDNNNLPITERFQIQGDPRHNPYADLKMRGWAGPGAPPATFDWLGLGYNRYFDNFNNLAGGDQSNPVTGAWKGYRYNDGIVPYGVRFNAIDPNKDGWNDIDNIEVDVNRIFQILRGSLTRSQTIYTTLTGFSYYYMGLGGDIGYDDANGFPAGGITLHQKPYTGLPDASPELVDNTINGETRLIRNNAGVAGAAYWFSMPWLGELYPDNMYPIWSASATSAGNLPTGAGVTAFVKTPRSSVNTNWRIAGDGTAPVQPLLGTTLVPSNRRTRSPGCTAFFWMGTPTSTFHHFQLNSTFGNITTEGGAIRSNYNINITDPIANSRPFNLNVNNPAAMPPDFQQPAYGPIFQLNQLAEFYQHRTGNKGSALLELRNPSTADVSFQVINGLSPAGTSGTELIARWSFLTLVHSFFTAGEDSSMISRVRQLPRLQITSPNTFTNLDNPDTIDVGWNVTWKRWDGLPYTPARAYAGAFTEATPLSFALLYSSTDGTSWKNMLDGTPATPGVRPALMRNSTDPYRYRWDVDTFPQGQYLIRVEAHRDPSVLGLHYSFHQYSLFISR